MVGFNQHKHIYCGSTYEEHGNITLKMGERESERLVCVVGDIQQAEERRKKKKRSLQTHIVYSHTFTSIGVCVCMFWDLERLDESPPKIYSHIYLVVASLVRDRGSLMPDSEIVM